MNNNSMGATAGATNVPLNGPGKEIGHGLGYIGAPPPGQNNMDTSNIFNPNTLIRLQTRKTHLDYWLRTT